MTLILLSGVVLGITFVLSAILDRDQGAITQLYSKYYIAKVFHYTCWEFWDIPVTSVADPDLGIRIGKSGSGMNMPDHLSESLETIFMVNNTFVLDADLDRGPGTFLSLDPGSAIEKFGTGIRDKHPESATLPVTRTDM